MTITNLPKISSSVTNQSKISSGETWASILTTWATETNTWAEIGSLIDNLTKVGRVVLWATGTLPWQLPTPWLDTGGITNLSRPS